MTAPDAEANPPVSARWSNLKRTGVALLAILLVPVAVILCGLAYLLATSGGGRWVMDQVPGLSYQEFDGQLGKQWQARQLQWQSETLTIALQDVAMRWSPGCLWQLEVCLEKLAVGNIAITTHPGEETAEEPATDDISLPEISLPVDVAINSLSLGRLTINDSLVVEDLSANASLTQSHLHLESLTLAREDLQLALTGDLTMSGHWPVEMQVQYRMPLLGEPLEVGLEASGRIARNVHLRAGVNGAVAGTVTGQVQPLEPGFPAELTALPTKLPIPDSVPATLHPDKVRISAVGNLNQGWSVEAEAGLPTAQQSIPLLITGHVTTGGAQVEQILLGDDDQGTLGATGELSWADGFTADADLSWRQFPWQRLFPEIGELPQELDLQTLDASVSYADNAYQGELDATVTGPAGPSTLATPFEGDLTQVTLPAFSLRAGPGSVEGLLGLSFADALGWTADLQVQNLNPGYWIAAIPGQLNGTVESEGSLAPTGPDVAATVDLTGELRGHDTRIRLQATGNPEQWEAEPLLIRFGANRIDGSIRQGEGLGAQLDVNLADLGQLWPGLSGSLAGQAQATGWPANLRASLNLNSNGLGFEDQRLETLAINLGINQNTSGSPPVDAQLALTATSTGVEVAGQQIDSIQLNAAGTLARHQLRVRAEQARGDIDLTFTGGSDLLHRFAAQLLDPEAGKAADTATAPSPWAGALSAGSIRFDQQHWRLQSAAPLAYSTGAPELPAENPEQPRITLGAHCWAWDGASLCAGDQRLWPEPRIRLTLKDLPSQLARPFMPRGVRWQATINGEVELDMDSSGPRGRIVLDAAPGQVSVIEALDDEAEAGGRPDWIEYPYDTLRLTADLDPQKVVAEARLAGPDLGGLSARVAVTDPQAEVRALDGSFTLDQLNLALARPFAELQELAGVLNGHGEISGTLTEPRVSGQIRLEQGQLADRRLPLQFQDLTLLLDFSETGASLEGSWRSGEEGRGRIAGDASWGNGTAADIRISGQHLPARVEPFAEVEVAPDLRIGYQAGELSVSGEVAIPRGSVEIRELPPQAVAVSDDTVIVGQEPQEAGPPLDLSMDLAVLVGQGEGEVTFAGFGVTGELVGRLQIGDDLDTRGELGLRDGRYEIYGQELTLRRANLIFAGPISQPYLDIEAIRQVNDVTAGIRITGPADQPDTEVFAEPSMSEEQALSYLILGRPLQSQQDNNVVGSAAISIGLNQAAPLTRAIGERLGIQDLQLDTEGSGNAQRVVASGYLTDKLSIRYGISLFEAANRLALRYDLTEQLYLEAASGLASSLDIFYSRDYR